ncbi:sulfate adenylyltransferase [Streptomyces sp. PRKS01-29]|uniref:Sulfate adenylyltransferase n=2 Tax=Streptomyces TaxID=1883 RepID=A0ABT9L0E2_9ACTN|nr:sulfate adenylyltransferase [Streptomyces sabulosicollis]MBP2063111.1 hypothetical protein [Streptomyces iranensis]MBW8090155.1 sulfate adenylyltransferase [Streptomyces hygroscopicus subsp. hygroscopicus]MCO8304230.1 sulfate adenylyltransferase [Streptomyces sp. RKCA744]MDP9614176.1 hypothetical protein [Streptomyces demainii]
MGLLTMAGEVFSTFAKEGGRVGSGALGSGQGGVGRCAG